MLTINQTHALRTDHGSRIHTIAFSIGAIVGDGIVVGDIPGITLIGCKNIQIANGIAGHVIMGSIAAAISKIRTDPESCGTSISIQTITSMTENVNTQDITADSILTGEVTAKTVEFGTIKIGLTEFEIPADQMGATPDSILLARATRKLETLMASVAHECDMLKNHLDGKNLDLRKIAVNTKLPDSVIDLIR
ncbi:hypothetical protein [Paremcibacter congregatus]|uniref:hypothetical protein n=1 Tax=Paremcibacter congregatus TaxID=2043170 RepID=UPI003A8F90DC